MEKKFSSAINEQAGAYTVVLNCWYVNAEGVRITVASEQYRADTYPAALNAADSFYNQHKD